MKREIFLVSRAYSEHWWLESVAEDDSEGDSEEYAEEHGFVYEDSHMTAEEAIRELRECSELSVYPVRSPAQLTGYEWASTEGDEDYRTGRNRTESVRVKRLNGKPLSPKSLFVLFHRAKLIR
jgi:hypothetical protein